MPINANTMYYNLSLVNRINMYRLNLEKSTERLSTGKAINSAADSPSDILRISRLSSQIMGSHAAQRNIQDALSLTQVMEGALTQMHDMGLRLKELSVRYNDSAITADEKSIIEKEAVELAKEMKEIMGNTEFGGINVFGRDQYYFQTGNSVNDNITIVNPLSNIEVEAGTASNINAISSSTESGGISSRAYDISLELPTGQKLSGEIQLDSRDVEQGKNIDYTINTGNGQVSKGKLSFVDDDTANFELHVITQGTQGSNVNIKYTGTLELNGDSSKADLSGEGTFTLDSKFGGWSGKATFILKPPVEEPSDPDDHEDPEDPGNGGIDFEDIDKIPVSDLLRGDFIDKNILEPLSFARASVGIDQRILEYRMSRQIGTEEVMTTALSRIEDVDMAKELMEKVKNDLLLQTNIQLLSQNLDDQRNYVLDLIKGSGH